MSNDASTDFTLRLRDECLDTWEQATGHRFVDELFAGTLDDAVLLRFLIQDYQFFDPFLALLGQAVAAAPTTPARLRLSRQLGMLATDENSWFESTFNAFDVDLEERLHPPLTRATVDLLQLMYEAIESRSWPRVLAVLLPLEWVYLDWADDPRRPLLTRRPEHLTWIDLHRGEAFQAWVTYLRQQLDAAEPGDPAEHAACQDLFTRTVAAEVEFFDAAYAVGGIPDELHPVSDSSTDDLSEEFNRAMHA